MGGNIKRALLASALSGAAAAAAFLALAWLFLSLLARDLPRLGVSFFDAPFAGFIAGLLGLMPFVFAFSLPALGLGFALLYHARLDLAPLPAMLKRGALIGAGLCGGAAFMLALLAGAFAEAFRLLALCGALGALAGAGGAALNWRLRMTPAPNAPNQAP